MGQVGDGMGGEGRSGNGGKGRGMAGGKGRGLVFSKKILELVSVLRAHWKLYKK